MELAQIEELLNVVSTFSGYTDYGERTLSYAENGCILDYINSLRSKIHDLEKQIDVTEKSHQRDIDLVKHILDINEIEYVKTNMEDVEKCNVDYIVEHHIDGGIEFYRKSRG